MKKAYTNTNSPVDTVDYGETVIPSNRLDYLYKKCKEVLQKKPGNIIEVGVYKGGTLIVLTQALKEICPEFKVFGIDTFEGHPYTDGHPIHPRGKYNDVGIGKLQSYLNLQGLSSWVTLYKGKVEEIFHSINLPSFSFAHVDCDLYHPIAFCSQNLPSKMNKGGVIYFDDYGHEHCPGATKAVDENFKKDQITQVVMEDDNSRWSCFITF